MDVATLIPELSKYPPHWEVVVPDCDGGEYIYNSVVAMKSGVLGSNILFDFTNTMEDSTALCLLSEGWAHHPTAT